MDVPPTPRPPSRPATVLNAIPAQPPRPRPSAREPRGAGLAAALLIMAAVILLVLALPLDHVRRTAEPDRLARHATTVLADRNVRSALTAEATTRITSRAAADSGLSRDEVRAAVRPRVASLVASPEFAAVWENGVRLAASRLLDPDVPYVALTVDDVAGLTASVTRPFPPSIARALRNAGPIAIVHVDRTPDQQRALEMVEWLNGLSLPLLIAGIAALLLALAVSRNRRRTVIAIGGALIVLALVVLGVQIAVRAAMLDLAAPGRERAVTRVVWDELVGGLRDQSVVLLVLGALLVIGGLVAGRRGRRGPAPGDAGPTRDRRRPRAPRTAEHPRASRPARR